MQDPIVVGKVGESWGWGGGGERISGLTFFYKKKEAGIPPTTIEGKEAPANVLPALFKKDLLRSDVKGGGWRSQSKKKKKHLDEACLYVLSSNGGLNRKGGKGRT